MNAAWNLALRMGRALRHRLASVMEVRDMHILEWSGAGDPPALAPGTAVLRYAGDADAVLRILHEVGRDLAASSVHERLKRGLEFIVLTVGGSPVATTWMVRAGRERFIDEIGVGFAADASEIWLRDVFVIASARHRGYLGQLLAAIRNVEPGGARRIGAVITYVPHPGRCPYLKYGFRQVGRYTAVVFARRVTWRARWRLHRAPSSAFHPRGRFLFLGQQYRSFVADRRA